MATSSVTLHSRFPAARKAVEEAARRALAQTGRAIAEATKENMYPGHFLQTGLSKATTTYEQLTENSGQVHVPTVYAAKPEFGDHTMAPRPALGPAVARKWPGSLIGYYGQAIKGLRNGQGQVLPPTPSPGPPMAPIDRPHGGSSHGGGSP